MQHHEGDGDAQLNSPAGAVKNAGIAVPALFTEKNPGHLVFPGNMAEYLSGADVGTGAAADALIRVKHGSVRYLSTNAYRTCRAICFTGVTGNCLQALDKCRSAGLYPVGCRYSRSVFKLLPARNSGI